MPVYRFDILEPNPFLDGNECSLPSREEAWNNALQLARDIEGALRPGQHWLLRVSEDQVPIYEIAVNTKLL